MTTELFETVLDFDLPQATVQEERPKKVRLILDIDGTLCQLVELPFQNAKAEFEMKANDRVLEHVRYSIFGGRISARVLACPELFDVIIITGRKERARKFTEALLDPLFPKGYSLILMPDSVSYDPEEYRNWKVQTITSQMSYCDYNEIYDDDSEVIDRIYKKRPSCSVYNVIPERLSFFSFIPDVDLDNDEQYMIGLAHHYLCNRVIDAETQRLFVAYVLGGKNPWAVEITIQEFVKCMKANHWNRLYLDNAFVDKKLFDKIWEGN